MKFSELLNIDVSKLPLDSNLLTKHHWVILSKLWNTLNKNSSVSFDFSDPFTMTISESIDDTIESFIYHRNLLSMYRTTEKDSFGLLGLSLINPNDDSVFLTEGVSDYFTAKLLLPNNNVLGVTTLGGNQVSRKIVVNLFNKFTFFQDNDIAGMNNVLNWKSFLSKYNKIVNIVSPSSPFKDITDEFTSFLKSNYDR